MSALLRPLAARAAPVALLGAAAALLAATAAWPRITVVPREQRSRAAAAALLDRVASAERDWARRHGGYAPLAPDGTLHEARARDPGPDGRNDFEVDALPQPDGGLRLRVVSRPEAIAAGRLFPVLLAAVLPAPGTLAAAAR